MYFFFRIFSKIWYWKVFSNHSTILNSISNNITEYQRKFNKSMNNYLPIHFETCIDYKNIRRPGLCPRLFTPPSYIHTLWKYIYKVSITYP